MGLLSPAGDGGSIQDGQVLDFRPRPAAYGAARGLIGSAARVSLMRRPETAELRQHQTVAFAWQERAWRSVRRIGEVGFAFELIATHLSRVRIHAAVIVGPDAPPVEVADAVQVKDSKDQTHGTPGGVSPRLALRCRELLQQFARSEDLPEMLHAFAINYQVPGECYLVRIDGKWQIKSTSELRIDAGGIARLYRSSAGSFQPRILEQETPIGRIWNKDPRYSGDAYSSLVPVLDDCDELILLSQMIRNVTKSRMNAGILFIPDGFTVAAQSTDDQPTEPGVEVEDDEDGFEKELMTLVTDPLNDEYSASAAIPMLVRGPGDQGSLIKWISMARDMDQHLAGEREKVLSRILEGINAQKDSVGGIRNMKFANAQVVNEQTYKVHVEPLALTFVTAVTDIYLRPMLLAERTVQGWDLDEINRIAVWYDPSEVVTRPDRGADADAGYDRGALSDAAWRHAHGFGDSDKPDERELAQRNLLKNPLPQDVAIVLAHLVFADLLKQAQQTAAASGALPAQLSQMLSGSQEVPSDAPTQSSEPSSGPPPTQPKPASSATPDPADSSLAEPAS